VRRENSGDMEISLIKSPKPIMNFKKVMTLSVILAGASAMASQIVFMREFLVVFYGNEISIGIILASWLIWGAFGSACLGRLSDSIRARVLLFALCQLFLAVIFPLTLVLIRLSKPFMGIVAGEIIGYYPMFLTTFLVLALPCAVMGFMFSLACRVCRDLTEDAAGGIAHVYIMEAIGSLSGGLLASYIMIRYMTAFSILLVLSFLNIIASMVLQTYSQSSRMKKALFSLTLVLFVAGVFALSSGGAGRLEDFSLNRLWSGFRVLDSKNSIYGNITVTKREKQISFYENGLHLYTVPDRLQAEESVHFALLETESPREVLLIGGGVGGLLKEILKYPVTKVDYVELDPLIIRMAEEYLARSDSSVLEDAKVAIINEDGRFFIKRAGSGAYDTVIISLGDPYTAQLNRFYTVGFFREVARVLKDEGVLSFGLTSSINYIGEELRDYLRSIYLSVREVFPEVLIIPGDTSYFIASKAAAALTASSDVLTRRMEERGVDTLYVRDYYLFDTLSGERVEYIRRRLTERVPIELNTDFRPISYYYATVFWGTQFDMPFFKRALRFVTPENIWLLAVFFCLFILVLFLVSPGRRKRRAVLLAVMTTGFAEINFQIAVVLSFQVIYGYVFYKLGIIFTSFMVGLALGAWVVSKSMKHFKDSLAVFSWTQVSICLYPLILPVVFLWLSRTQSDIVSKAGANIIFPFLPVISGFIGGVQFPLANKIYLEDREKLGRVAGLSYGLDLLGACLGSFLAAAFLVPILGIFQTCFLVAVINATVLAILLL